MKPGSSEPAIVLEKIREQVSLTEHLISLVPSSALEWRPEILKPSAEPESGHNREKGTATAPLEAIESDGASRGLAGDSDGDKLLRMGDLLGHLLDCMAGFCALLYSINEQQLAHFGKLRSLDVNHFCEIEEARSRVREYMSHIEEGFALLDAADLGRMLPTVFVPEGESILTLLLGNLEHLINHKYQLFIYLRLLGVPLGTKDLYRIRGGGAGS